MAFSASHSSSQPLVELVDEGWDRASSPDTSSAVSGEKWTPSGRRRVSSAPARNPSRSTTADLIGALVGHLGHQLVEPFGARRIVGAAAQVGDRTGRGSGEEHDGGPARRQDVGRGRISPSMYAS